MGIITYSVNLNISSKISYGVLECDIVMLQNYMLVFCYNRFWNKKTGIICARPLYNNNIESGCIYTSAICFCQLTYYRILL